MRNLTKVYIFLGTFLFSIHLFSQPQIITPINNYTYNDSTILISWITNTPASYYNLQISTDTLFNNIILDTTLTNNHFIFHGNYNSFYFVKVRNFYNSYSSWSNIVTFSTFSPFLIEKFRAWYDYQHASIIDNNKVDTLFDLSGNNNNLTQSDSNKCPVFQTTTGSHLKSIHFDGNNQYLKTAPFTLNGHFTIFIFFNNLDNWSYNKYILDGYNYANARFSINYGGLLLYCGNFLQSANNIVTNPYNFTTIIYNHNESIIRNNFSEIISGNPGNNDNPEGLTLGTIGVETSNPDNYGNFDLFEILVFDTLLSDTNIFLVENYLKSKYASPVSLGPDIHIPYSFCDAVLDAGARFTNYHWSTGDTTQTITVSHSGTYSVTVTDIFGFQSSDTIQVYFPELSYDFGDTTICQYDTIAWNSGFADSLYTTVWQNGDTTNIQNIYQSGQYHYKVIDTNGCFALSDTIAVSIDSFPSSQLFSNDDTTLCIGTNLYVENTEASTFLWNTGDTTNFITMQDSGIYYLTAHNQRQCITHDTVTVSISGIAPIVDFSIYGICQYDTILFINNSFAPDSSNFSSFLWQIDTLTTSHNQDTSYVFQDSGTYRIALTVNTENGCSNTINKYLHIHHLPVISLSFFPICSNTPTLIAPQVNTFGIPATYKWTLDSNIISTADTPNTILNIPQYGNHYITLQVTDTNNCKSTYYSQIEVKPTPEADFSFSGKCENKSTTFTNQTNTLWYNPLIFNKWYFGDGDSSLSHNTTHTYTDTGYYNITLYTKAVNGCKSQINKYIHINPTPHINFTDTILCANTQYHLFTNIQNAPIHSYKWLIDSTIYSTDSILSIIFPEANTHQLLIYATSDSLCTSNTQTTLHILPQPQATFNISSQYLPQGHSIYANATDTSYPYYLWQLYSGQSIIDRDTLCGASYYYSPIYEQNNMLLLIVKDTNGCYDTSFTQFYTYNFHQIRVSVIQAKYTYQDNYLQLYTLLKNEGEAPTSGFKIISKIQGIGQIASTYDSTIYPKETKWYQIPSNIYAKQLPQSICLWTENSNIEGFNNSNVVCISPSSDSIQILNVYPVPAKNYLYMDINMPYYNGDIIAYLTNTLGQQSKTQIFRNLHKGVNTLKLNLRNIGKGIYMLNVISGSYFYQEKIIVD